MAPNYCVIALRAFSRTKRLVMAIFFSEDLRQQILDVPNVASRQLFAAQPRGQKLRPLVSEYGRYVALIAPTDNDSEVQSFLQQLPKGAKVCHRVLFPGGVSRDDMTTSMRKFSKRSLGLLGSHVNSYKLEFHENLLTLYVMRSNRAIHGTLHKSLKRFGFLFRACWMAGCQTVSR